MRRKFGLWARAFQRKILVGLLALLYWLGFAAAWLGLLVFNRRRLDPTWRPDGASGWVEATGYDIDEQESTRPS